MPETIATNPADPRRCQAVTAHGQCSHLSVEGGHNCIAHGGIRTIEAQQKEKYNNYLLNTWQASIDSKKRSPELKSLRDEIAILRMLLEARLNQCTTAPDLMLHSSAISDMAMKIEKTVQSCHKLEQKMGAVLDKQQILDFASQVISIVSLVLDGHPEKIEQISNRILEAIGQLGEAEDGG